MKKFVKVLSLLFVVPLLSVCLLSGCKDKPKEKTHLSYGEAKSIINSVYSKLYPSAEPTSISEIASANGSNDIQIKKETSLIENIAGQTNSFIDSENGVVVFDEHRAPYLSLLLKTPIGIVKTLLDSGKFDLFNGAVVYSYENQVKSEPTNLAFKVQATVYSNTLVIEYQISSTETTSESAIIAIGYDSSMNATTIGYTTSRTIDGIPMFACVTHNLSNGTTKLLNIASNLTTSAQTSLKTAMSTFATSNATADTTYDFYTTYRNVIG